METLKTVISWVFRLILAGVFIYAGFIKLLRPDIFFNDISNYQILPTWTSYAAAYFMPAFEIFTGVFLLTKRSFVTAAIMTILMMLVFITAICSAWLRGLDISCGCFGNGETGAYAMTILRDSVFLVMACSIILINKMELIRKSQLKNKNRENTMPSP